MIEKKAINNQDILWLTLSWIGMWIFGFFACLFLVIVFFYFGGKQESIPGGAGALIAFLVSVIGSVFSAYRAFFSPIGEVRGNYISKANVDLENLDDSGNTIPSTRVSMPTRENSMKFEVKQIERGVTGGVIFETESKA